MNAFKNAGKVVGLGLVAAMVAVATPAVVMAAGGPSGTTSYKAMGQIGAVRMNPYDTAPLTALIMNGGYKLTDVTVTVKGKGAKGIPISYRVSDNKVILHGGIPVWGLYPDYLNTVEVTYKKYQPGGAGAKVESIKESYEIYAPPVYTYGSGVGGQKAVLPRAEVVVAAAPAVKNNLYLMNHLSPILPNAAQAVWNNPVGGALEWDNESYTWIVDTNGDIRWYLKADEIRNPYDIRKKGNMMGYDQTKDGALVWGMGQSYMKYDLMGREIFKRQLPFSYIDFSHHIEETPKGTYLLRVASSDFKRKDGKNVRTVRDVIVEVDKDGNVLDEWRTMEILDPYRDVNLLALDQGAVCLNIDASKAGHTMSKEEMEQQGAFGDVTGVGPGRNWAHINSVNYDPSDDSVILSVRNQSAVVKIGRDKQVKWILASPAGWTGELAKKILTPVDAKGKKIACENSTCEGSDFDWTWTQHTAYKVNEKSKPGLLDLTVFDNGDSRGMEQPALPTDKYSRAVEYKIDEKNMTVQQTWEFGKERGIDWYSPITSVVEYQPKTDSLMVYSATAGMGDVKAYRAGKAQLAPFLHEFKYGTTETLLEMKFVDSNTIGYRALNIDLQSAFQ